MFALGGRNSPGEEWEILSLFLKDHHFFGDQYGKNQIFRCFSFQRVNSWNLQRNCVVYSSVPRGLMTRSVMVYGCLPNFIHWYLNPKFTCQRYVWDDWIQKTAFIKRFICLWIKTLVIYQGSDYHLSDHLLACLLLPAVPLNFNMAPGGSPDPRQSPDFQWKQGSCLFFLIIWIQSGSLTERSWSPGIWLGELYIVSCLSLSSYFLSTRDSTPVRVLSLSWYVGPSDYDRILWKTRTKTNLSSFQLSFQAFWSQLHKCK